MDQDQFDKLCWAIGIAAVFVVVAINGVPAHFGLTVGIIAAVLFAGYVAILIVQGFVASVANYIKTHLPKIPAIVSGRGFLVSLSAWILSIFFFWPEANEQSWVPVLVIISGILLFGHVFFTREEAQK